ncbi:type II toxin-antitoxin system Phd/YefM family antitoxin, partial [Rhodovulum sulfidophilum]
MWTLQDAKNRFSAVVEAALAGVPQEVTRRGKPAVVVLSADDYRRLLKG